MTARFLATAALACGAISAAFGYTQMVRSGSPARWPGDARIVFTLNSSFAPNNPPELVAGALRFSFSSWNTTLAANGIGVRFAAGGTTSLNEPQCDQVNLVTFTKTLDPPLPPGVLAATQVFTAAGPGLVSGCGAPIQAQFAGQILDADLIFNTSTQFSTVGLDNTNDIEHVALHEIGHLLGLGHSGVSAAVMAPSGGARTAFAPRSLHPDDIAGINAAYGTNAPGGVISGRVFVGSEHDAAWVLGAQVVATEADTGLTRAAALSGPDGRYRIVGLSPGDYRLFVEPLDGPVFLQDVSDAFAGGSTSFYTVFRASLHGEIFWHPVSTGETFGNFGVGPQPQAMNAQQISVDGEGPVGPLPISIKRGTTAEIRVLGTGLSGNMTFSAPTTAVTPIGATTSVSQGLSRTVQIAPDAPVGALDVYVSSPLDGEFRMSVALTGALQITVNPSVFPNGIVEGAAYNGVPGTLDHFSAGSIISIFGADLAKTTAVAAALPLPTQLGGIGVRVGNRLAPLYFASPGQINAMIPFELSGTVGVEVVAGENSRSSPVSIALAPSAPRIFSINQQGTGQGAILIANTNVVAAPRGSIAGRETRPARHGDLISIFCMGLGPVSNPPPSGAPASGSPLSHTLSNSTVTIGGVPATVTFSGLAPGFVGLYQVNVQVPATAPTGDSVPVVMLLGGAATNSVTVAVE
ncbi:MAG: hypothetical protein A3J28_01115 [Acidobacteria bacterium RIFCSPLOWO2_12_FULL_60_22]|nr:MAG: hypothetical protein A3J28_01115 [Acidobacteria bacterium RIFCSPLOWO2_12_FULL_60_22]